MIYSYGHFNGSWDNGHMLSHYNNIMCNTVNRGITTLLNWTSDEYYIYQRRAREVGSNYVYDTIRLYVGNNIFGNPGLYIVCNNESVTTVTPDSNYYGQLKKKLSGNGLRTLNILVGHILDTLIYGIKHHGHHH